MPENILKFNKEHNKGKVTVDMNLVKDYYPDENSVHNATKINYYDGTSITVADTIEQIAVLLKWKKEGKINSKGNFTKKPK